MKKKSKHNPKQLRVEGFLYAMFFSVSPRVVVRLFDAYKQRREATTRKKRQKTRTCCWYCMVDIAAAAAAATTTTAAAAAAAQGRVGSLLLWVG
jgi:hypothetical protein